MAAPSEHDSSVANLAAAIIHPPVKKRNRLKLRDEPVLVKIMQESGIKAKKQVERKKKAKLDEAQKQHALEELAGRHSIAGQQEKSGLTEIHTVVHQASQVSQDARVPEGVCVRAPVDHGLPGVPGAEVDVRSPVPVDGDESTREKREEAPRRPRATAAKRHVRGVDIAPEVHKYMLAKDPYYRLKFAGAIGMLAGSAAYAYAPAVMAALHM